MLGWRWVGVSRRWVGVGVGHLDHLARPHPAWQRHLHRHKRPAAAAACAIHDDSAIHNEKFNDSENGHSFGFNPGIADCPRTGLQENVFGGGLVTLLTAGARVPAAGLPRRRAGRNRGWLAVLGRLVSCRVAQRNGVSTTAKI